ncbi:MULTISPECIES: hypothetical protein [unclassified Schlesneria]|uniref:hypothetical protein n=1 Tax=Schlesneria TaxID=656899 RepID=UPI002EEA110D
MVQRAFHWSLMFCAVSFFTLSSTGNAYGPGPRIVMGPGGYYNAYGQGVYGQGGEVNAVNSPGFRGGYGRNINNYPSYGFGPYGYGYTSPEAYNNGNSRANFNYNRTDAMNNYGNAQNSGEGFNNFYSPYGWGTYSQFTNGW